MSAVVEAARTLRPAGDDRHGPLAPLLLALTVVTGLVDAVSYLALGHVFVANMTGNVVFLAFAIAGAKGLSISASLTALAAFLAGALAGGRLGVRTGAHRGRLLRGGVAVEVVLVAGALAAALAGSDPVSKGLQYTLIPLLALAMGVQNASARRLAVPDLTTTVLTLTLVGVAADAPLAGGNGSKLGRRGLALAAMFVGALSGALLVLDISIAASLGVALGILAAVALCTHLIAQSHAAWVSPA